MPLGALVSVLNGVLVGESRPPCAVVKVLPTLRLPGLVTHSPFREAALGGACAPESNWGLPRTGGRLSGAYWVVSVFERHPYYNRVLTVRQVVFENFQDTKSNILDKVS